MSYPQQLGPGFGTYNAVCNQPVFLLVGTDRYIGLAAEISVYLGSAQVITHGIQHTLNGLHLVSFAWIPEHC